MMWVPVAPGPIGAAAGVAGFFSKRAAKTALPVASLLIVANGIQGTYLHVRGIAQRPGGWALGAGRWALGEGDRFPGFDVLREVPTWDVVTTGVVLARLAPPRLFDPGEEAISRALLDQLLDQRDEPRVPVLEMVDARWPRRRPAAGGTAAASPASTGTRRACSSSRCSAWATSRGTRWSPRGYRNLGLDRREPWEMPVAGQQWPWGDPHRYPQHPVSGDGMVFQAGCTALGIPVRVGPVAIANGRFGNRPHCIYRGFCLQGCKVNANVPPHAGIGQPGTDHHGARGPCGRPSHPRVSRPIVHPRGVAVSDCPAR
jgi:hypothetical protein